MGRGCLEMRIILAFLGVKVASSVVPAGFVSPAGRRMTSAVRGGDARADPACGERTEGLTVPRPASDGKPPNDAD